MTDIRGDIASFDYFNESLICDRAFLDYWRAPAGVKRERKAFRKYCAARRTIKRAFEAEHHVMRPPTDNLPPAGLLTLLRATGRNMLNVTVETPFYMVRNNEMDVNSMWIQLLPPEKGANLELFYVDIDANVMEVTDGVYVPSAVSVFGMGPDVTSREPSMSLYAIPVAQNRFTPQFRSMN